MAFALPRLDVEFDGSLVPPVHGPSQTVFLFDAESDVWTFTRPEQPTITLTKADVGLFLRKILAARRAAESQRGRWFVPERLKTSDGAVFTAIERGVLVRTPDGLLFAIPMEDLVRFLEAVQPLLERRRS